MLSVIAYHLNPHGLPGGFTGVDIFFTISGYVVSASAGQLHGVSLRGFLTYFYARRLFRIAPALIVCLVITALALALFVPFAWLSGTNQKSGLAAFFGFSNFVLAGTDNDYFSPRVDFNPFTHTWSLGVEEQFYLIFPWAFITYLAGHKRLSAALVAAGLAASLAWAAYLGATNPDRAFYMLTSRFWELAAGVLLYQLRPEDFGARRPGSALALAGALAGLVLIAAGLVLVPPDATPFPGGLLPVLGTLGVIGCLAGRPAVKILDNVALRYVGKISYSLYLWHWPVFVLFRWTSGLNTATEQITALALTAMLSVVSYHGIETPPRRAVRRLKLPRIALVGIGVAALGAGYGSASLIFALQPHISRSTVTRHAGDWYPDGGNTSAQYPGCVIATKKSRIATGEVFAYTRAGCAGAETFAHTVFVIGDSHAAAYEAMLKLFALQTGAQMRLYGVGGCSFIGLLDPPTPQCASFGDAAVKDMLARLRPGDVVFLPSLRVPRMADQYVIYGLAAAQARMASAATAQIRAAGTKAALPVLQQFANAGAKIVFEAPGPEFQSPAFRCADWYDRQNPICAGGDTIPRTAIAALRAPVLAVFAQFSRKIPAVSVWDPLPLLCPGPVCSQSANGEPLFFDGDHLSGYGDRMLEPSFAAFVAGDDP